MPLVIKEQEGHFEPAPPGLHEAVCVDVVDLGMVDGKFGPKRKLKLVWQLKMRNKQGEPYQVRQSYTQSLFDGSNLRRDLESWRGRSFTDAERKNFDVEKLIGVRLTDSFLMVPMKSISGILFPTEVRFESCQLCPRKDCPGRRAPYDQALWSKYAEHP